MSDPFQAPAPPGSSPPSTTASGAGPASGGRAGLGWMLVVAGLWGLLGVVMLLFTGPAMVAHPLSFVPLPALAAGLVLGSLGTALVTMVAPRHAPVAGFLFWGLVLGLAIAMPVVLGLGIVLR